MLMEYQSIDRLLEFIHMAVCIDVMDSGQTHRQFENRSALYLLSVCRAGSEVDDLGIMHEI